MGEIAAAIGQVRHWEPFATHALAASLAYLGPAASIGYLKKRFLGAENDGEGTSPTGDKP
jgi:hypothetical protein